MPIILENLPWMVWNVVLAFVGLTLSYLILRPKKVSLRLLLLFLWLIFIPNTIYLLTDIQYLPDQIFKLNFPSQLLLLVQYSILLLVGVITFILSLQLFQEFLRKFKINSSLIIILILNYLISFGVFLGKLERVNSWDIFFKPQKALAGIFNVLHSPETILLIILFGSFCNLIYFFLQKKLFWKREKKH